MKLSLKKLLIIFLFLLALFFRFWQFGKVPPGLSRDEASQGYTAYSLLQTGQDEYGNSWPLSIKSFGDWKMPVYVYANLPFVALFGLQNWVVRLPTALAGILTIIITYLLSKKILNKKLALLATLTLAFLPWHLHFSRYGHEANLGLLFLIAAILFFFKGLKKASFFLISAFFFGLTLYSYYAYFIFTPLFLIGLTWLYLPELKKNKKIALISLTIFLVLASIIFRATFSGAKVKSSISFLTDPVVIHSQIEIPRNKIGNPFLGRLIYNKVTVFIRLFSQKYLAAFLPNFLAIEGGLHPLHNFPGLANIFWWQYPLFLFGLTILLKQKRKASFLLLWWLLISPIGSSLTKDAPNSGRVSMMIIPLAILISLGLVSFIKKRIFLIFLAIIICFSLFSFYKNYFLIQPQERIQYWGANYQELVKEFNLPENKNKPVVMKHSERSPYIYILFYEAYDPEKFQQEVKRYPPTEEGFEHVQAFGRYQFEEE